MLILGLDSTAIAASAAVADIRDGAVSAYSLFTLKNKLTHSETLLPMVEQVLSLYGATPSDLELIAVNAGPGSFTGVRIGVSAVKGLAFPKDLPCAPVSTPEALAQANEGTPYPVCALMDARRGQFYTALFRDGNRLTKDDCLAGDAIVETLAEQNSPILLCGDGSALFYETYKQSLPLVLASPVSREQNALATAICGYRMHAEGKTVSPSDLRPIYLRLPQAERERLEKQG